MHVQVAENIKEFFHNNGIHSTTIQPEFLDTNGYVIHGDGIESDERERSDKIMNDQDCALTCPKDEEKLEPNCQASKCCPDPKQARSEPSTPKLTKDARSSWRRSSFGYDTGGGGPTAVVTSTPGSTDCNPEVQILMPPAATAAAIAGSGTDSLEAELLPKT